MKYNKYDALLGFALWLNGSKLINKSNISYKNFLPKVLMERFYEYFVIKPIKPPEITFNDIKDYPEIQNYFDKWNLTYVDNNTIAVLSWIISSGIYKSSFIEIMNNFEIFVSKFDDVELIKDFDYLFGFDFVAFDELLIKLNNKGYLDLKRQLTINEIIQ